MFHYNIVEVMQKLNFRQWRMHVSFNHDELYPILEEAGIMNGGHFGIACLAAFGYRINEQPPKIRKNMREITTWVL